jgi:hypothetical protein
MKMAIVAIEGLITVAKKIPPLRSAAQFFKRVIIYRRYPIYKWETVLPENAKAELEKSGFRARLGSEDDLVRLARTETWRSCDSYRKWFNAGREILLLEKDDQIMSYVWLDFGQEFVAEQVPEMRFRMPSDTYYSDEAYTPVAFRGLGLRRLSFIAELLLAQSKGYRFMISYFLDENARFYGLRNFNRTGNPPGEKIKEIRLLKIPGFRFAWLKDFLKDESLVRIN